MDLIDGTFTILIADDDPDDRFLAQTVFDQLGLSENLKFAQDGKELLSYLNQSVTEKDNHHFRLPHFILLDLNMPEKDGWETLEEIKSTPDLNSIPVVIWTTSSEDRDRLRSAEMGADRFVTKPGDYSNLLHSIRSLIEMYCGKR